jgi:hypothetical protein
LSWVMSVTEIDEERLRRGLRGLLTVEPPVIDDSRSRGTPWVGGLAIAVATVVVLAGVLTTTLLLRNRATVGVTPPSRPTLIATPEVTPEPTPIPSAMPTPFGTPAPAPWLPAVGPPCTVSELEVRVGKGFSNLSNGIMYLIFTDKGRARCALRGTPIVQFLDARGQVLASPRIVDVSSGYVPTLPNSGVGLLPLSSEGAYPGTGPEGGMRGQASLPLQYYADGCNNSIAAIRIRVAAGTLTVPLAVSGGGGGCQTTVVFINPFQPAEYEP